MVTARGKMLSSFSRELPRLAGMHHLVRKNMARQRLCRPIRAVERNQAEIAKQVIQPARKCIAERGSRTIEGPQLFQKRSGELGLRQHGRKLVHCAGSLGAQFEMPNRHLPGSRRWRKRDGAPTVVGVENRAGRDLVPVVIFRFNPEGSHGRHTVLLRHARGELDRAERFVKRVERAAEQSRLLTCDDGDGVRISETRRGLARGGRCSAVLELPHHERAQLGARPLIPLRIRNRRLPRRWRRGIARKKRGQRRELKCVIGGELSDSRDATNVDRNVQQIYVTIRPLTREDSVLYFPPEAFGPFKVLHQIGAGALGPVFRAFERDRDRLVAVKVFRLDLTPEQAAALVDHLEAFIGANITHPHIAAPIAAGIENGSVYLAQEYVVGDSLDVVLRDRGRFSTADTVELVESLAAAIDHAASRGVQHRMLHPRDVIVSGTAARLTGFGVSSALSRVAAKLPTRSQYSAPDGASDIYSLGAIAFEALTGKRPSPENVTALQTTHGARLADAFAGALASSRGRRPQRAREFANLMRSAAPVELHEPDEPLELDELNEPHEPDEPDEPLELHEPNELYEPNEPFEPLEPDTSSRRWPIAAAFVAFALIVATSVGYLLRSTAGTSERDGGAGVDETVVDLPAAPRDAPAPRAATEERVASDAPPAAAAPGTTAATPPVPAPPPQASGVVDAQATPRGSLLIRSSPADADVTINGNPHGKTPLAVRDLEFGSYTIRIARNGYATEERTLQLTPSRPSTSTIVDLRPFSAAERAAIPARRPSEVAAREAATARPGGLRVLSRPSGARVFVNGRLAGSTPLAVSGISAGPAAVRIELEGYQAWTTTVRVAGGGETRVAASLDRR